MLRLTVFPREQGRKEGKEAIKQAESREEGGAWCVVTGGRTFRLSLGHIPFCPLKL